MIIENLFPKPIGFFKFDEGLTEIQNEFLLSQEQYNNVYNGTSENKYILKSKELENICTFIEKCAHEYFMATYSPKNDVNLRLTQSWANYTKVGQQHHKHSHSNSFISGCFYVNADKGKDKIYFQKTEYFPITFPTIEWNPYNSETWWYPIGTNDLIFFPSSLTHYVAPVESEETRISIAFNLYPVGHIGDETQLTALYLR